MIPPQALISRWSARPMALSLVLVVVFATPALAQKITVPDSSAREIITQKPGSSAAGVKGLQPAQKNQTPGKSEKINLKPEVRPAVEAVTPQDSIGREPKTFERSSPGLAATLYPGKDTEITGVFNMPGSQGGSVRPYSQSGGHNNTPAPSAGVLLKRSF
ncbi:hypothetical protein [Fundidesulfovibrio putealis]|uniref:hypothetical protein n=1 Tax=Fundidesulfovibrio putealis TaxID=270496 RepID=UPI000404CFC7|nr:hypothetical protein [Fundidesulfovibrio putealis]